MKIVVVALSRIPSETANSIQVMKVCQSICQAGHEVKLIIPDMGQSAHVNWDSLSAHYGLSTPFDIEWLPLKNRRLFALQAVLRARAMRPDALYTWVIQSAVFGLAAGLPTIFEAHELPGGVFGPWWYRVFIAFPARKRIAAITNGIRLLLEQKYGRMTAGDFVIAPMGVDLERFLQFPGEPSSYRCLVNLPDRPTVMCTGHLYAGRGVELFVAMAEALPQAQFVWVGGTPADVQVWRARTSHLANLTLTGFVPNAELPRYQAAADVLVMPYGRAISGSSGGNTAAVASPMKMFEYLAAGRAIVTSDLPVFHEVLNEKNAIFCPPDDLQAWVVAVNSLLTEPGKAQALAIQAKQDALKYSWVERTKNILAGFV